MVGRTQKQHSSSPARRPRPSWIQDRKKDASEEAEEAANHRYLAKLHDVRPSVRPKWMLE